MGILKSSFTGGQWTPQESNPCYPSCQRNAMRSTSNDYKRCYTVANLQEQACLTNQQGRARNERAMSCLTRQQEISKIRARREARREARKGPKAHSLLRNDAPVVLVLGAPIPVLLKQSFECRLDGRSNPFTNYGRNFAFFGQNRLAILTVDVGSNLGSFPLVLD